MTVDFSSEIMKSRRKWHNILQMLKENNCQQESYIQGKYYLGEGKLSELGRSRPTLKE
jgi:hypothetical protein